MNILFETCRKIYKPIKSLQNSKEACHLFCKNYDLLIKVLFMEILYSPIKFEK